MRPVGLSVKNFNYTIRNRSLDIQACSAVPEPTAVQRAHGYCSI